VCWRSADIYDLLKSSDDLLEVGDGGQGFPRQILLIGA
jgi:hypothetical protein